jgi:hypothetical protein
VTRSLLIALQGICAGLALAIGIVFLRFRQRHHDSLFLYFAVAFWVLAINWALLSVLSPDDEARPFVYSLRLMAFLLIIVAIAGKNRSRRP